MEKGPAKAERFCRSLFTTRLIQEKPVSTVLESIEDQNVAWHCGAKVYRHPECRNANSIGIEMCVRNKGSQADTSKDWYFEDATVQSAISALAEPGWVHDEHGWIQWNSDTQRTGSGDWYYLEESGEYAGACWHERDDRGEPKGALVRWYVA